MSRAVIFPGQGSQAVGMEAELLEAGSTTRDLWDRIDTVLERPLTKLIAGGPKEALDDTENAQPALFAIDLMYWRAVEERGWSADYFAGHSLGELAACAAAGVFSFEDGLKIVSRRAAFMAEAAVRRPGGMLAVLGLEPEPVGRVCRETGVELANLNSPGQIVVAGDFSGLDAAESVFQEMGAKRVVRLAVSGPFHSSVMAEAAESFSNFLGPLDFNDPEVPIVSNVTARPVATGDEVKANLVRQIESPVRWVESVVSLIDLGVTEFVEAGPGRVLSGLVKRISRAAALRHAGEVVFDGKC